MKELDVITSDKAKGMDGTVEGDASDTRAKRGGHPNGDWPPKITGLRRGTRQQEDTQPTVGVSLSVGVAES